MSEFYFSEWFLPSVMLAIAFGWAAGFALFTVCSGRAEELKAGIDIVLADKPVEDFFGPYTEAMPDNAREFRPCPFGLSDADYEDLFDEIDACSWRTAIRSNEGDRDV